MGGREMNRLAEMTWFFAGFFDFLVVFLADFLGAFAALAIVFAALALPLSRRLRACAW